MPVDDAALRERCIAGMAPAWAATAAGSGGSVWERDGITAAIVPKAPSRSVFNSVFYADPAALLGSLDDLHAAYEEAGVWAWTVWVPDDDLGTGEALGREGHVLDAQPRYMGMNIDELIDPGPTEGFEFRESDDRAEMARLNEIAYGYPPGDFEAVADAPLDGLKIWFADLDGEPACTLAIFPLNDDAEVLWVAAVPEARGRGVGGGLLAHALRAAADDDLETTTLQSTKLGAPVYTRLGYRDLGSAQMWERRSPEPGG